MVTMADEKPALVLNRSKTLIQIPGYFLALSGCFLPFIGFVVCVAISLIYEFERSTSTHCRVKNYLPSISSAIGGFTPQRYIWRMCIALHCGPRFLALIAYYNYFRIQGKKIVQLKALYSLMVFLAAGLNLVENFCLLLLTCVSSTENYSVHETSFITFMVCSEIYMVCSLILFRWSLPSHQNELEKRSLKFKLIFFAVNLLSCLSAAYFFYRHNTYCEPGVYTMFALSEYCIVMSNIAYHGTALLEFGAGKLLYVNQPVKSADKSS